ncbi:hypothetical protein [Clostridium estertheticum]|uniref:hypothetical protein n=1 Tax=Clostridium estertheticum TaxID=238834 RepID=UPI001C7D63E6|nr:hypothetical protein [Clostridium estertheticum]MBX4271455.1 hypothetical protein [Clostridium estertheticum]WLC81008.1 hypothetical protein KTC98_07230 [Clostridium estertheticum]
MTNSYIRIYCQICKETKGGEEILTDFLRNVINTDNDIYGVRFFIDVLNDNTNINGTRFIIEIDSNKGKAKWIELSEKEVKQSILFGEHNDVDIYYEKIDTIGSYGIDIEKEDYTEIARFINQHSHFKGEVCTSQDGRSLYYSII